MTPSIPTLPNSISTAGDGWLLRDGTRMWLHPMLAGEQPLLDEMLDRMSPAARRNRFHGGGASRPGQLEAFGHSAGIGVSFVITAERGQQRQVVAEARYAVVATGDYAEFALAVDERWQRRGLGQRCMRALVNTASHAGLHWLCGDVLADNRAMLALMQRCHFCCTPDGEDERMVHAETAIHGQIPATSPGRHFHLPQFPHLPHTPAWLHWPGRGQAAADTPPH